MSLIRHGVFSISVALLVMSCLPHQGKVHALSEIMINIHAVQIQWKSIMSGLLLVYFYRGGARYADMDERPYCRRCFERVPAELRRRLKKQSA